MNRSLLKLYRYEHAETRTNYCTMDGYDWKGAFERAAASGGVAGLTYVVLNGTGGTGAVPVLGTRVPAYAAYGLNGAIASVSTEVVLAAAAKSGLAQDGWQKLALAALTSGGYMYYFSGNTIEDAIIGFLSVMAGNRIVSNIRSSPGPLMY